MVRLSNLRSEAFCGRLLQCLRVLEGTFDATENPLSGSIPSTMWLGRLLELRSLVMAVRYSGLKISSNLLELLARQVDALTQDFEALKRPARGERQQ